MSKGWIWPWLLAGMLLVGVGANVALVVVANADPSFAVEEDYYERALAWDAALEQQRRNDRLGWTLTVAARPSPLGAGWTDLEAALVDPHGRAIAGASVELDAFHNARAADVFHAVFSEDAGRGYVASLPIRRSGLWELRVRVVRGEDRFTTTLVEHFEAFR